MATMTVRGIDAEVVYKRLDKVIHSVDSFIIKIKMRALLKYTLPH